MDGVAATGVDVAAPVFGRYRIDELLGRGGMGTVHRAYDVEHRRMVALKRLPEQRRGRASSGPGSGGRRGSPRGCAHPHVVPVHDFGEIDGQLFLDMMLVEGIDLRRLLGSRRARPAAGGGTCSARSPARWTPRTPPGLVHRDVKPSNILIDPDDHAYLADFGIARSMSPDATGADPVRRAAGHAGTTWPRSGCPVGRWTAGPTSTRWPACCSSA